MRRILDRHKNLVVVLATQLALVGAALADDVSTSFEFNDVSGVFSLGNPLHLVTFTGGEAKSVGKFELYHTGLGAWMIDAGNTGTITFEPPVASVDLWFKDQFSTNNGVLTVIDAQDAVIDTFDGSTAWANVVVTVAPGEGNPLIARITLENNGAIGYSVIDDFASCVDLGNPGLEDPLPEPITKGGVHIQLDAVATGLAAPIWGTFAPGSGDRLFVADQSGVLWVVDLATGDRGEFLSVSDRLVELGVFGPGTFDERGLLGVAFHPDYATNGLLYTYTSEPWSGTPDFSTIPPGSQADHHTVILEWHVPNPGDPQAVVNPGSARELLRIDQPQFNHNAGALNFGHDGMLYISLGDGGGADDRDGEEFFGGPIIGHGLDGNGQNAENVLGTVLRIDPDGSNSANGQYGIPADNPFVDPVDPRIDEIFAFGFRNPFRFSFDMVSGDLYLADVGQNDIEEVDVVTAGGNYGWNLKEGSFFFDPNDNDPGFVTDIDPGGLPDDLINPRAEYDHDEGIAIIGGFVYRGSKIPVLAGRYVFGDWSLAFLANNGRLFYLDESDEIMEFQLVGMSELGMSLQGFAQDADGEIYVLANSTGTPFGDTGVVLKITTKPGDFDANGVVNVTDLLRLLAAWGRCNSCPEDIDDNGAVGASDLLVLLSQWG